MHILPDLRALEDQHSIEAGAVVLGVHSAKFENEKLSANILSAVRRYDITHPVVNDKDAELWQELEINCWPTLLLLGPENQVLLQLVGEGHREVLLDFVGAAVEHYDSIGQISHKALEGLELSKACPSSGPLLFPGKVAVSPDGERLAIADTGHHRVIITSKDGVLMV